MLNSILSRPIFILSHEAMDLNFYQGYRYLMKNQWKPFKELKEEQEAYLRRAIHFYYDNVPYYRKLFNRLNLSPDSIRTVKDLEKLPILTKEIIKQNWEDFKPVNLNKMKYYIFSTGGSVGKPFVHRLSKFDRFFGGAMMYRGWGYGGYRLGDKVAIFGGASLNIGTKFRLVTRMEEIGRNVRMFSSFDMSNREMEQYARMINDFKPRFIRGYAGSIYFFAKWIEENDIRIHKPVSAFLTAEKLYPHMREKIGNVFSCDVFDNYGLNDGGISAYECPEHMGLHIDTERSIMEVVDENGCQLDEGEGRILATSLHNYAMPFVRYDTGDLGYIIKDTCSCGRGHRLLKEVVGRTADMLVTPEGKNVHGYLFVHMLRDYGNEIKEYQVVQETVDKIQIKLVVEDGFDMRYLDKIRDAMRVRSEGWNVEFKFVDKIGTTGSGKYKFIENKLLR